jgi:hypothetical protein
MHKSGTGYTCDMHVWEGLVCLHVSDFECKANVITLECKANTITPRRVDSPFCCIRSSLTRDTSVLEMGRGVERWRDVGGRVVCGGRCDGGQR